MGGIVKYGFKKDEDNQQQPYEPELVNIKRMFELQAEGLLLKGIISALKEENRLNRSGKPFAAPQVCKLLKKEALYLPVLLRTFDYKVPVRIPIEFEDHHQQFPREALG